MSRKESDTDELAKLVQMRDSGYLTEQEFARRKKTLLYGKSGLWRLLSVYSLATILLGTYFFWVFHDDYERSELSVGANGVPKCNSRFALDAVERWLRNAQLEVLDVKKIRIVERKDGETGCSGMFVTTKGRATIVYRISRASDPEKKPFIIEVLNPPALLELQLLTEQFQ